VQGSIGADSVDQVKAGTAPGARLRVALDATPLLGDQTGVGAFCAGALASVAGRPGLDVGAFAVSWRRRQGIVACLPAGVGASQRAMPARPLHALWGHFDAPPIEWFIGKADVVHGTNFVVPPTARAAAVVSVHDLTPLHHPELCNPATLAFPGLIRRAVARGAWVHADSAFVAAEVADAFELPAERVRVVHPGIPELPAVNEATALAVDQRWPVLTGRRIVLAIGTAEPRKDLPGLVDAFDTLAAAHRDTVLVLAGPPGWGEADLQAAIDRAEWKARIVRTGWVDPATLAALLARAAVLAYPSRYEGFGFPPLQAMQAGVPVVATGAGSLREVLGAAASVVEVGDTGALTQALSDVLEDEALRARLTRAGRDRAEHFSWDRCGDGLEELYREAAEERRG
jgi:glycosyltransferase involved in cell wall biosynthesis